MDERNQLAQIAIVPGVGEIGNAAFLIVVQRIKRPAFRIECGDRNQRINAETHGFERSGGQNRRTFRVAVDDREIAPAHGEGFDALVKIGRLHAHRQQ